MGTLKESQGLPWSYWTSGARRPHRLGISFGPTTPDATHIASVAPSRPTGTSTRTIHYTCRPPCRPPSLLSPKLSVVLGTPHVGSGGRTHGQSGEWLYESFRVFAEYQVPHVFLCRVFTHIAPDDPEPQGVGTVLLTPLGCSGFVCPVGVRTRPLFEGRGGSGTSGIPWLSSRRKRRRVLP